eukprot:5524877-Amphidinium_carterae.1
MRFIRSRAAVAAGPIHMDCVSLHIIGFWDCFRLHGVSPFRISSAATTTDVSSPDAVDIPEEFALHWQDGTKRFLFVHLHQARDLRATDGNGLSNPFCLLALDEDDVPVDIGPMVDGAKAGHADDKVIALSVVRRCERLLMNLSLDCVNPWHVRHRKEH